MDISSPLPPGLYHYSVMAADSNHVPPTLHNANDFHGVVEAVDHYESVSESWVGPRNAYRQDLRNGTVSNHNPWIQAQEQDGLFIDEINDDRMMLNYLDELTDSDMILEQEEEDTVDHILQNPIPPGVYHDSATAVGPNPNINHIRSVDDFYDVDEAFNHYRLQHPLHSPSDSAEIHYQVTNYEVMYLSGLFDSFDEGQSMMDRFGEEEWQLWDFLDQDVSRVDFSSINHLSKDIITKHLKTRPVVEDDHEDKICVVCQDCLFQEDDKIATLDCGHEYHVGCIKNWLMQRNCCPLCNATGVCVN